MTMRRLGYLVRLIAVAGILLLAWDALLFRSGLYYRWLEPASTAGMTRSAIRLVDQSYAMDRRNVLVLGNSRIGEGFSQRLADDATQGNGLHFLNAAIPGTNLRAWYYLLRRIDPQSERFAAVVLPIAYDPGEPTSVLADYPLDIAYLTPLLGSRDLTDFPATFDDPALAERARRAIIFPAQPLRDDIEAFLAGPQERLEHVRKWRKHQVSRALQYPGRDTALVDLSLDPNTLQPTDWRVVDAKLKPQLSNYFDSLRASPTAAAHASNERYFHEWLSRIAEPYRAHGIPVIVISVPRGPWHAALPPPRPAGAVAQLIDAGVLTALPGDSFVDLEQPRYFFDSLHLNRAGREQLSHGLPGTLLRGSSKCADRQRAQTPLPADLASQIRVSIRAPLPTTIERRIPPSAALTSTNRNGSPVGQTETSIGLQRVLPLLKWVAIALLAVVAWDAVVFRSGLYMQLLEPQSLAGSTRNAVHVVEGTVLPGRRNVLVVGNSRIGEGLAPDLADAATEGSGLHFVNGFIAGSDLRVWYYLLREVDPQARRFSAVVLATPFDPAEMLGPLADNVVDIGYLVSLLRLQDVGMFPASFDDAVLRNQARRSILFPAQAARRDIAAFLAAPLQRYHDVRDYEKNYLPNLKHYPGRSAALPDLPIDPQTLLPTRWDGIDETMRTTLTENYFRWLHVSPPPAVVDSNQRYFRDWLTRIAAPYHANGIPVILIEVPRGPWHGTQAAVPRPGGTIAGLIDAGLVSALPGDTFTDLEQPRYFFDAEHMNRAGRERFTPRLAQRIAAMLH